MLAKVLIRRFKIHVMIIFHLLVVSPLIVSAAQVSLEWSASNPAPDGYRIYQRTSGQAYNYDSAVWTGTTSSCTIDNLSEDVHYYFVVRAYTGTQSSSDSNEVSFNAATDSSSDSDGDGDGVNDAVDAFPTDPNEMEDTDPSINQDNRKPDAPSIDTLLWDDLTDLNPEIKLSGYADEDGDVHQRTRYQLSITSDFSQIVFDRTSTIYLTDLTIPDLILDPDTRYYLRVQYIDDRNGASGWSDTRIFTTSDYSSNGDSNANGVLDEQELSEYSDLDGDGTNDQVQAGIIALNTPDHLNPQVAVKRHHSNVQIVAVRGYGSDGLGLASNLPAAMTGLVSFKLYLESGVSTASVTIHLTRPAPEDGTWYKYDIEEGWYVYPNVAFSEDRLTVTLMLEDGGIGDQDGIRNGVIVDPAGLAYNSSDSQSGGSSSSSDNATANGGCFIGVCQSSNLNNPNAAIPIIPILAFCAGLLGIGWLVIRKYGTRYPCARV